MWKVTLLGLLIISEIALIFFWQHGVKGPIFDAGQKACTLEAKICPDGSTLGRGGPNCEFPACPDVVTAPTTASSEDVTLSVGGRVEATNVIITLGAIPQDNRCPKDVNCVLAGSVTAEVVLQDSSGTERATIISNDVPYLFNGNYISIVSVSPDRQSKKEILPSQYKVTFRISR